MTRYNKQLHLYDTCYSAVAFILSPGRHTTVLMSVVLGEMNTMGQSRIIVINFFYLSLLRFLYSQFWVERASQQEMSWLLRNIE